MSRHETLLEIQVYQHRLMNSMSYSTAVGVEGMEEWDAIEREARDRLAVLFANLERKWDGTRLLPGTHEEGCGIDTNLKCDCVFR